MTTTILEKKAVFLSEANFRGRSIAGAAVAAHEVGHAIQDQQDYAFMRFSFGACSCNNV